MLITYGWYEDRWWTRQDSNCTAEDRASVLDYTLVLRQREIPTDKDAVAEPGIVSALVHIHCRLYVPLVIT